MKKYDFDILTYLYVLRAPEFVHTIFTVMYACMCVCMRLIMAAFKNVHWIKLKFEIYIIGHQGTNPVDFGEYWMHSLFIGVQKILLMYCGL